MRRALSLMAGLLVAATAATDLIGQGNEGLAMRWERGCPNCKYRLVEGLSIETVKIGGAEVSVGLWDTGTWMRANVVVLNTGRNPFEVYPEKFVLSMMSPKQKVMAYQSPEQMIFSVRRDANRRALAAAIIAANAKTTTQTSSTYSELHSGAGPTGPTYGSVTGSVSSTVTQPDYLVRALAAQVWSQASQTAREASDFLTATALRSNTVDPGRYVGGLCFFGRDKKATLYILAVRIGDVRFEFPFSAGRGAR